MFLPGQNGITGDSGRCASGSSFECTTGRSTAAENPTGSQPGPSRVAGRFWVTAFYVACLLAMGWLAFLILGNLASARAAESLETRNSKLETLLAALRHVETGGDGRDLTGDGGEAIGPYQIHRAYWLDAKVGGGGTYADCHNEAYARAVVLAYFARYAPAAYTRALTNNATLADFETLARIHNGGPRGASNPTTLAYWRKVQAAL